MDDPGLGEKLIEEAEGIFLWCLEGLHRLIENNYAFTISEKSRKRMEEARKDDNNMLDFIESSGYIMFEENTTATSKNLYAAYKMWCDDNAEKPFSERSFATFLKSNSARLNIVYDKNLCTEYGKTARGYHGIFVKVRTEGYG